MEWEKCNRGHRSFCWWFYCEIKQTTGAFILLSNRTNDFNDLNHLVTVVQNKHTINHWWLFPIKEKIKFKIFISHWYSHSPNCLAQWRGSLPLAIYNRPLNLTKVGMNKQGKMQHMHAYMHEVGWKYEVWGKYKILRKYKTYARGKKLTWKHIFKEK